MHFYGAPPDGRPRRSRGWATLGKIAFFSIVGGTILKTFVLGGDHMEVRTIHRPAGGVGFHGRFAARSPFPNPVNQDDDSDNTDSDSEYDSENESKVCRSQFCIDMDNILMDSLASAVNRTDVDPCTDFYTFSCAGWQAKNPIPEKESSVSVYTALDKASRDVIKSILDSPYTLRNQSLSQAERDADRANYDKMKGVYNACMDEPAIKAAGVAPLKNLVDELTGFFPHVGSQPTKAELTNAMLWLAGNGLPAIARPYPMADDKHSDMVAVHLMPGFTGLSDKSFYMMGDFVSLYTDAMVEMFTSILGPATDPATHRTTAEKVVAFEFKLLNATQSRADSRDVTKYYNPMPITQVGLQNVDLDALINGLAPEGLSKIGNVINRDPAFFTAMNSIVANTDRDAFFGYFVWGLINAYGRRLHSDHAKPLYRIANTQTGVDPDIIPDREDVCLLEVDKVTGWIISAFYADVAFSPEAKSFGDEIIDSVQAVVRQTLETADWMSASVRTVALQKLDTMVKKIGYPTKSPNVKSPLQVSQYYQGANLTSSSYFGNGLTYSRFDVDKSWDRLKRPTDRDAWILTVPTVNAYYRPTSNEIAFPAGIMQVPLFAYGEKVPEYLSFAAFGNIAGHEITHGFDTEGSKYDTSGSYNDWWDAETVAKFEQRTQCFIDQYNSFFLPRPSGPIYLNGRLTQTENIADAGGGVASFKAWKIRDKQNRNRNLRLPRLSKRFTKDQIWFLTTANAECGNFRDAEEERFVAVSVHSPQKFRINGAVMENNRYFREAFKCPALPTGTPAPAEEGKKKKDKYAPKCALW